MARLSRPRRPPRLEELEARILHSADLAVALLGAPADGAPLSALVAQAWQAPQAAQREFAFIDPAADRGGNLQRWLAQRAARGEPVHTQLVDHGSDGLASLGRSLAAQRHIGTLHLALPQRDDGALQLGRDALNLDTLDRHAEQVAGWGEALGPNAQLAWHGTPAGHPVAQAVAQLAGAAAVDGSALRTAGREVVFIDDALPDAAGLAALWRTLPVEVVLLDGRSDGLAQVGRWLAQAQDISSVHLVGHGAAGQMVLGTAVLDAGSLQAHRAALAAWAPHLAEQADLLLYGCDVAATDAGRALMAALARLTGADVAASTDRTGSAAAGANWVLEARLGEVAPQWPALGERLDTWGGSLATFTVTNTNDAGAGSLRAAIDAANASLNGGGGTVPDRIEFNIALNDPNHVYYRNNGAAGSFAAPVATTLADGAIADFDADYLAGTARSWYRITLTGTNLNVTEAVVIDGSTQPGYDAAKGPVIEIDASGVNSGDTNAIALTSGASTVRGLVIHSADDNAIEVDVNADGAVIAGNYLGTDVSGTRAVGNASSGPWGAVGIKADGVIVGGTSAADRNVISGNFGYGVEIYNSATGSVVRGNYIGTNAAGTALLGNASGGVYIWEGAANHTIGGTTTADANLIAGNGGDGVWINTTAGSGNRILGNLIYSNSGAGIDLGNNGVQSNDSGDGDSGANGLQNFPALASANSNTAGTTIVGTLNSNANTSYRIEYYANRPAIADANGEGERYLGFITVSTDGSGNASVNTTLANVWVNSGDRITATATDLATNSTSEFAPNVNATSSGIVVVDTTSDAVDGNTGSITGLGTNRGADGRISLREAIIATNNTANGGTPDKIVFAIPAALSGGVHTITLSYDGADAGTVPDALPIITQALIIDGASEPDFAGTPVIELNGNGVAGAKGLELGAGSTGSTIKGLTINRFTGTGIEISGSNNHVIQGNWIGLDSTGTAAAANGVKGIYALNATGLLIGGTTAAQRNVISGNTQQGIYFDNVDSSTISGNYVGTNAAGTGDVTPGAGNNAQSGVFLTNGSSGNVIGGTSAAARNILSGNNHFGFEVLFGSQNNLLQGNYIGTDVTGLAALGNINGGAVFWGAGTGNVFGGNVAGARNVIAGNSFNGVVVGNASTGATIAGNYIGVGADGVTLLGNGSSGVRVEGASTGTRIGTDADGSNDAAERNVISGNTYGVRVADSGTTGTVIAGNYIGTDATGLLDRGNTSDGIFISGGATGIVVGGSSVAARNIIAGNDGRGVRVDGANANTIRGNFIGLAADGSTALGNLFSGVYLLGGAANNAVGGSGASDGNRIAHNSQPGVALASDAGTGNAILGNAIWSNGGASYLGINLSGGSENAYEVTANDIGDADTGANSLQNFPVLTQAITNGAQLVVSGSLNSTASSHYRIEFFASAAADSSGHGEGQRHLGFLNVSTDGSGNATISTSLAATVAVGEFVSATATRSNPGFTAFTDTSEFALNVVATSSNTAPTDIVFDAESTAESTVNTYPTGDQSEPAIAALPNGGHIAVWSSNGQDGSGLGIYGQRFDSSGAKVGLEFLVTGETGDSEVAPSVSVFADGGFVVAWQDQVSAVFAWTEARVFNADGTPATAEFKVSPGTDGSNEGYQPAIQALDSNRFVVVWGNEIGAATYQVAGRIYDRTGAPQGAQFTVGSLLGGTALFGAQPEAALLNDGGFAVAWRTHDGTAFGSRLRIMNSDGSARSAEFVLQGDHRADVAALENGNVVAVYGDGTNISARIFNPGGTELVTEFTVNTATTGTQLEPTVTRSDDGFVVAWQSDTGDGSSTGIYAQRFDASGNRIGSEVLVNTTTSGAQSTPEAIETTFGQTRLVWTSENVDGSALAVVSRVIATSNATVAENAANGTRAADVLGVFDIDAGDTASYSLANSAGGRFAINASTGVITVANSSLLDFETSSSHSITVRVTDSGGLTFDEALTVNLSNANDAPALGNGSLIAVNEDTASPAGQAVSAIFSGQFSDADAGSSWGGIAVIGNTASAVTQGTWQYSTNSGSNWYAIGAVADGASALVLSTSTLIRFLPAADYNGTPPALTVRGLDNTYAGAYSTTAGSQTRVTVDASSNGGSTPVAAATATLTTSVTAVNDPPVNTVPGSQATSQGTTLVFSAANGNAISVADVDAAGSPLQVTLTASNGTLTLDGTAGLSFTGGANGSATMTFTGTAGNINTALNGLSFAPSAGYTGSALLQITTNDQGNSGSGGVQADSDAVVISVTSSSLWLSSATNATSSAGSGGLSWSDGQVVQFGNPNLALGAGTTGGTFSSVFNIDAFVLDGNANLTGLHHVSKPVTVGALNPVTLQAGDVLFTVDAAESIGGVAVTNEDVVLFRPTTAGDYSSGTFSRVLRNPGNLGKPIGDFVLIENPVTVGGTALQAGDFLLVFTDATREKQIQWFVPTTMGTNPTGGSLTLLIDGTDVNISQAITGLELVQKATTIGGVPLTTGQLLLSLARDDSTVGDNSISVARYDIFTLNVTATEVSGGGTTAGTAGRLFTGLDVGISAGGEEFDAIALVSNASAAPVLTLPGAALAYTENDAATVIDAGATVSDVDSPNFNGGTLLIQFTANGTADDRLEIRHQGTAAGQIGVSGGNVTYGGVTIGSFTGGTDGATPLIVSLNASASMAATQALLRNVTFQNVSDAPSTAVRTVTFVLDDGSGGTSAVVSKTINVAAVNDAPVVTTTGGSLNVNENAPATAIDAGLTVSDIDSATLTGASVRISVAYANGQDLLAFTDQLGITGSWNAGSGTLTLSGSASVADYQTALRSVTYANTSEDPSFAVRTVEFIVNDGTTDSAAATRQVQVVSVNDAPTTNDVNATGAEDAASIAITLTGSDVDGSVLSFRLSNLPANGTLYADAGLTALVAAGADIAASANAATLYFVPNANWNGVTSFQYAARDNFAAADSTPATATITVTAVNDAPVGVADSYTVTEDGTLIVAAPGVLANDSDVDGDSLVIGVLDVPDNAATFNVTTAGNFVYIPVANYVGTDSFSYIATDNKGGATGIVTVTITVTALNDAPTTSPVTLTAIAEDSGPRLVTQAELLANANDVDGDSLSASGLAISTGSGSLVDNGNGTWTYAPALNDDTAVSFSYAITDGNGGSAAGSASLDITPVNDAPVITSLGGAASGSVSVQENATAVTTVTSSDIDGGAPLYSIVAGGDGASFSINPGTGVLSFITAPDYEVPTDVGGDNVYNVTVQASDGNGGTDTQTLSVSVLNQAVTPGGQSTGSTTGASLTLSHTSAGSDRLMLVSVSMVNPSSESVSTISFNGTAMTRVGFAVNGGNEARVEIWALVAPDLGTHDVVVTLTGASGGGTVVGVRSFSGVDQPTPLGGFASAGGDSSSPSVDVASDADHLVFAAITVESGTDYGLIPGAGQTQYWDLHTANANGGASVKAGAASVPMTWTFGDTNQWAIGAVSIRPSVSANAAPVINSLGGGDTAAVSVAENTAAVTTVMATDADLPAQTISYSIIGGADASRFTIDAGSGTLAFVAPPNFDAPSDADADNVFEVIVQATDGVGGADTQFVQVTVTKVNEAPSGTDATLTIDEDTAYTFTAADFGFTDPSDNPADTLAAVRITTLPGAGSLTLNGTAVAAGQSITLADIGAGLLRFTPTAHANGAGYASFGFQVQDDGGTANGGVDLDPTPNTITINVTAVNDLPAFSALDGNPSYTENAAPVVLDADVSVADADLDAAGHYAGATLTLVRQGGANAQDAFFATGNLGALVQGGALSVGGTAIGTVSRNSLGQLDLAFDSNATGALVNQALRQIAYQNQIDAPPSSAQIQWLFSDGNAGAQGPGGPASALGSTLVNIVQVNDAPLFVGLDGAPAFTEGGAPVVLDGDVTVFDNELGSANIFDGASLTLRRQGGASAQDQFSATGTLAPLATGGALVVGGTTIGQVVNNAGGSLVLAFNAAATPGLVNRALQQLAYANGSDAPPASVLIDWVFSDGNASAQGTGGALQALGSIAVGVTAVNDAPVLGFVSDSANVPENSPAVLLAPSATVTDLDSPNFDGGQLVVQFSANGQAEDRLAVRHLGNGAGQIGVAAGVVSYGGAAIGTVSGGGNGSTPLVVNLNAAADAAAVQALARSITYQNVSENPSTAVRSLQGWVTDGDGGTSNFASGTLNILPANDAPVLAAGGSPLAYVENAAPAVVDGAITVADVDHGNLASATVRITSGYMAGQDVLGFTDQAGITGTWNAGTGTLSLSGSASLAAWQAALRSVTYANTSDNPVTTPRTVSFVVNDGVVDSAPAWQQVQLSAVNDNPSGAPTVQGTPAEFQVLTADTSAIADADGLGAFAYQWQRNGVNLAGATAATYSVGAADVGSHLSVMVSWLDAGGSAESLTSAAVGPVANVNDPPTGAPLVVGSAAEDQVLSVDTSGLSDADGLGAFAYQWLRDGVAVTGATATSFTLGDADVGHRIGVRVSYTDDQGTPEVVLSAQTVPVANLNDAPTGVPLVLGTVVEDQTLTADTSGIADADGLGPFSLQWLRDGVAVAGATGSSYILGDADVGARLAVRVTYTDLQGSAEALTSAATAPVANVNDAPTGQPAVLGSATEDQTLAADTSGIADADGLGPFSFQWLRDGMAVAGANGSTYTPGDADVGTRLSVQVAYTDLQGAPEILTSAATLPVVGANDAPVGLPLVQGTATEDQTLGADTSGVADADGLGAFTYQWLRDGVAVAGATGSSHTLGDADVGARLAVRVTYTDLQGTAETLTSAATARVASVNDAPTGAPLVQGTATEDQTLAADTRSIADADGLGAFTYQWLRDGVMVAGATGSTYTLGDADVGARLSVRVAYTDLQGTAETLTSAATAPVASVNDAPTGVPLVQGSAAEDQTLTANANGIADADGLGAFAYQWLRDGVAVAGATGLSYTLGDADVGTRLAVQVTYTDLQGTAETLTSAATAPVANVNDAPRALLALPDALATEGQAFVLSLPAGLFGDADPADTMSLAASGLPAWLSFDAAGMRLVGTPGQADVGALSLTITATDASGALAQAPLRLEVRPVNDAPVLAVNTGLLLDEGGTVRLGAAQLMAQDADDSAAALTWSLQSAPQVGQLLLDGAPLAAGGLFTQADVDAGRIAYRHAGEEVFADAFELRVSDPDGVSTDARVSVQVGPVNDQAPNVTGNLSLTVAENSSVVAMLAATDSDLGSHTVLHWRIAGGADAARFSLDPATGRLNFLASPDHEAPDDADADGRYQLLVRVDDGVNATLAPLEVRVVDVNEPLAVTPARLLATEDTLVSGSLAASWADPEGAPTQVALEQGPRHGTLVLGTDGSFEYLPQANYVGEDSFSVIVSDGTHQASVPVRLTVAAVNDAPQLQLLLPAVSQASFVSLGTEQLRVADVDSADSALTIEVRDVLGGYFEDRRQPGQVLASFTLEDLAAGHIGFRVRGLEQPQFLLRAQDGATTSEWSEGRMSLAFVADSQATAPLPGIGAGPDPAGPAAAAPLPAVSGQLPAPAATQRALVAEAPQAQAQGTVGPTQVDLGEADIALGRNAAQASRALARQGQPRVAQGPSLSWPGSVSLALPEFDAWFQSFNGMHNAKGATGLAAGAPGEAGPEADDNASFRAELGVLEAGGLALAVVVLSWALRAGGIIGSLALTAPAWRLVDPLPVVGDGEDDEREPAADDRGEALAAEVLQGRG